MNDPIRTLIRELERDASPFPEGFNLTDPVMRKEVLGQPTVHFKLSALPPRLADYLAKLQRSATATEEEVVCDYLDSALRLSPRFCTIMNLATKEIWVTQTEEETQARKNTATACLPSAPGYALHQLHGLEERVSKGKKSGA